MGRKGIKPKLLMCVVALSTMVSGILGGAPLHVKAAEEENYTVTFEAYEGTCETESISVPKGESLTLPEASYEGHYLESWIDVASDSDVTTFRAVGRPGDTYTPERDLWLYANWKPEAELETEPEQETELEEELEAETELEAEPGTEPEEELEPETGSEAEPEQETELKAEQESDAVLAEEAEQKADVSYEARIGENYYEDIEAAFENAQDGDTITVLKDCIVSKTLVASAADLTLTSEDVGNPVMISRDEEFEGKNYYKTHIKNVLLGIEDSLTIHDIILDGGAELDGDFNNTGQVWDGPMVYVKGTCTMEDGTVLQNNYNTNNEEERTARSAGALHVDWEGTLTMSGGLIHHCYTNGGGGGIQTGRTSNVTITAGTIRDCRAYVGGALEFYGPASVSGMTISGNKARAATVGIHGEVTLSGCLIENNTEESDGGTVGVSENSPVIIEGCTIRGNRSKYTSAISYSGISRTEPLTIRDCTITGNVAEDQYSGSTITYMTKAPLILDGKTVMEGNTVADGKAGDIRFYYEDATPVTLGADFESGSVFVMSGRNSFSGAFLVDAASNGKKADASQFVWKSLNYRTEEKEGNIYLAEVPVTYIVTYDANNSSTGSSIICSDPNRYTSKDTAVIMNQEALFPLMGNIVKFGYDFTGWNTKADGTGDDYAPGQEINLTKNLYLYAKWKAKEPVTLTYIYNGGEGKTDSEQVIPGANVAFPDASRKGYSFKGWYEDEALTVFAGKAGENHYATKQDASYYAAWEKAEATVTFDADGGKMEGGNVTAKIGDTITLPACTKDGYEFVGWYDGDTCIGQAGEEYTVSDDVTLKAHYVKKGVSTGTITFDADGGKMEGGNATAKIGDAITLPNCTKDGYEFIGWYDNDICVGRAGKKYTVTGDATLKARYEKKAEVTYLITFDPNGGRKAEHIRAVKGTKITLPGTEKSGYVFLGWYTEKENGILLGLAGDGMEVTKDMTVYALWEKEKAEENGDKNQETCKAVFHTEGGTLKNKTVTIAKGSGLYLPLPEREGYDFAGWYLDQSLTQFAGDYRDSYRITRDTDFYAKWEKSEENSKDQGSNEETTDTYTVKYDANGGTVKKSSAEVAKGAGVKLPAAEREGFTFKGWYTDNQVFVGMAGDTYKPEGDICLYAKWESAASGNSNGSTADTGNSSDANAETSTDSSAAGKSVDTGAGASGTAVVKEPVIQTGRTSPIYLLAALGMFGILLAALSIREGKRSSME